MSANRPIRSGQPIDNLISVFDGALRTVSGVTRSQRENPAQSVTDDNLTEAEKEISGRLMRINHCGEVCAQALYLGQGLTSTNPDTREAMEHAAAEEIDHLDWCQQRLDELGTHKSHLNPLFFGLSFAGGAVSGLLGDKVNLGFVAATEEQVVKHLESHLDQLPEKDQRSRAILEQMRDDEQSHRTTALRRGGADFPSPVKSLMTQMSKLMTRTTYWV